MNERRRGISSGRVVGMLKTVDGGGRRVVGFRCFCSFHKDEDAGACDSDAF
jgi:hypothetical protein